MAERLVARWASRSGKHHVTLYHDALGYFYNATGGSGYLGKLASDEAAIRTLEPRVNDFQPDRNRTPMVRTNPRANPRFSWHKIRCLTCGRVERYRGLAHIGAPGHRCMSCHGATKVTEMHWGPEKYAASRGKTGLVEKLTPQQFYAPFPPGTRY